MTGYHRLPPTILASLCGGGDRAERDVLRAGQVSKRLVQLRAILDLVDRTEQRAGRAAGLSASYAALAAVQRADPGTVADLLDGPQVGAWAAACLRRLGRGGPGRTPLWVHLAHLGSVAAAAAARAGVPVEVAVPVRAGVVSIPTVGRATPGDQRSEWALVDCAVTGAGLLLAGRRVDWELVRRLRVEAGGVVLRVAVDEVDAYWRSFGLPVSARLTDRDVDRWRTLLERAWAGLAARHPHRLATIAAALRCLVPVEQGARLGRVSASSAEAPGAVALTEPTDPTRLAATLVHESQHFRLSAVHDLRPLYREPGRTGLYSPWRNDPRPFSGLVHGTIAFLGVADFWRREGGGPVAELEYARHVRQLRVAARAMVGAPELTELGAALVDALHATVNRLPATVGAAGTARIAEDLVAEHRAVWRLRNVVPDASTARAFALAWLRDDPRLPTPPTDRVGAAEPSGDNPLTRLAMALVEDETGVRTLARDPAALAARFPGASRTDLHLLSGDYATVRAAVIDRVAAGRDTDRDWAALAVAHARRCPAPVAEAEVAPLVSHPELVRAAWHRLPDPDPRRLTRLLDRYEAGASRSDSMRR